MTACAIFCPQLLRFCQCSGFTEEENDLYLSLVGTGAFHMFTDQPQDGGYNVQVESETLNGSPSIPIQSLIFFLLWLCYCRIS